MKIKRKFSAPAVDYRALRFNNLTSEEYRHLLYLLYWPVYGLLFLFVERFYQVGSYHVVYCRADDWIPFCELFVLPYLLWFVCLVGMHLYTLLYDVQSFKRMMRFIMLTYSVTILVYLLYPTCQELRPAVFARDNLLTRFMAAFYRFDTNTNVCPSIHVIGSLAVLFTALDCRRLGAASKAGIAVLAVLMSLSTVFLKQHSLIDVAAALPVCLLAYALCFRTTEKRVRLQAAGGV